MKIQIPVDIETLKGIARARKWEKAAWVWAFCKNDGPGRPQKMLKTEQFTIAEFAELSIAGLRSRQTVTLYWQAWQEAIDAGHAKPVKPGDVFILPELPWPLDSVGDTNYQNASDERRARYEEIAAETGVKATQIARVAASAPAVAAAIMAEPRIAAAAVDALRKRKTEPLTFADGRPVPSMSELKPPHPEPHPGSIAGQAMAEAGWNEVIEHLEAAARTAESLGFCSYAPTIAEIRTAIARVTSMLIEHGVA